MGSVRARQDIVAALTSKGFTQNPSKHHIFLTFEHEAKTQAVYTKVSHSGKDVGAGLLSRMARQCKLTKSEFLELVDCDLDGDSYVQILRDRDVLGADGGT